MTPLLLSGLFVCVVVLRKGFFSCYVSFLKVFVLTMINNNSDMLLRFVYYFYIMSSSGALDGRSTFKQAYVMFSI